MTRRISFIAILIAILATGIFSSSAMANVMTPPNASALPPTVTVTVDEHNRLTASDFASKRFVILSFVKVKGLSKKVVDHSECRMIGAGTNVPEYTNSGFNASGGLFKFRDTKRTKVCKVDGQWRKVLCGNFVWFSVKPNVFRGKVIMVRSFAQAKFKVHVVASVKATGSCGWAYASAKINQRVRLRTFVKSKGDVAVRIYMKVIDKASAKATAEVHCATTVTLTITPVCDFNCTPPPPTTCPPGNVWNGTMCVKDGNTTPQPPVIAPGPNPPPSGGAGDPGSHRCYNEQDPSIWFDPPNGLCPAGYYGA